MSDLETRLAGALRGAGARAPHPGDLVAPSRARLRRRRRTTAAAVATAVAVVAIPVGVQLVQQRTEPDVTTVVPTVVPDGWRTESFRDLTLRVPADWGYQGGPDWCLGDGRPAVTRVEGWVVGAGCEPRFSYGVQFRDVPAEIFPEPTDVPDDAFMELVGTSGTSAWIVAESEEQLAGIVESVRQIDEVDPNGCPSVVDPGTEGVGERVSVCRYDSGELEQSELLSVEDSEAAQRAILEAPVWRAGGGLIECGPASALQPVITLRGQDLGVDLLPGQSCAIANVLADGRIERLVTEDVLYWALSPGWQGDDSDLPLPDPLR